MGASKMNFFANDEDSNSWDDLEPEKEKGRTMSYDESISKKTEGKVGLIGARRPGQLREGAVINNNANTTSNRLNRSNSSGSGVPEEDMSTTVHSSTGSSNVSLSNIIEAQQFNGSWSIETLQKLLGSFSPSLLKDNLPSSLSEKYSILETALITAIVVAYLNANYITQKTLWELIVKKANTFIKKEITSAGLLPESCDLTSIATIILTSVNKH